MENIRMERKGKKQSKLAIIIFVLIFAGLAVVGMCCLSSELGGIPSEVRVFTDDNIQDFIDEQKEQGVEVIIED